MKTGTEEKLRKMTEKYSTKIQQRYCRDNKDGCDRKEFCFLIVLGFIEPMPVYVKTKLRVHVSSSVRLHKVHLCYMLNTNIGPMMRSQ